MGVIGLVLAFNILWAKEYYLSFEGIQRNTLIPGIIVYILALVFGFIAVERGIATALAAIALAIAVVGVSTVSVSGDRAFLLVLTGAGAVVGAIFVALIGSLAGAMIWADDWSVVQAVVFVWFLALILFLVIVSKIGTGILALAWTGGFALAGGVVANYCARLILVKKQKFTLLQQMAAFVIERGGTSFRHANLTDANFQKAELKSTDLRQANLTHTCWFQAQKLNLALVKSTYLEKLPVQELVTTRLGQDKNFDYQNLRRVNLQGANLTDASFIGADLSEANLQDADLTRAKLVQTQLDGTDFTGATLTGAYIEDWNITTDTKFNGVRCEYVYMRLPTPDNPDPHRKPDNRQEVFADGEFGDFIKPIFDTLDLYHNQGVDPRAIAISFKQLAENHPEADLRIVGMEVRGEDKFLLRAKTANAADKSELSAEYFDTYNQLKALAEQEVKALIAEKDSRIADLQNMVVTALQRPSFYSNVEQVGFMTNNPGGFSVSGSVGGDINNVQGENNQQRVSNKTSNFNLQNAQFSGGLVNADTVNAGQIGGNITNYNPEQRQNLAQAAAEIQQLLNQLSQSYPTATTSQRMTVVANAVDRIESNPTLKARVIGALKAGGTEAFKELIDHPLVNILLASIDGWQEAE
ncbi:pentapeptide repeat-containing protein [Nostoc sp. CCY 9925]|uniref:pentapeptide repeat-containing protein n=1 Tax=Nostoc sp. CCY 9925 TaxID=3103865 RepID=UPI0039C6226A